ncbi:MAG: NADH:flavin oxidoreductase [Pirellulaceae bacterium]|nr:MAG: NADH:flavin oxidoreductase [Pirellulaceae bacterium]
MYPRIAQLRDVAAFRARLEELRIELPVDERILTVADGSPMAQPLWVGGFRVGNRWCIHPMEGWDAQPDGLPSPLTLRRWANFGRSGAKWIWGGEAAAVRADGRANPRQTLATPEHRRGLAQLLETVRTVHRQTYGSDSDLFVGLQLTHSGRFSRPTTNGPRPRIAYHHPLLDGRFGIDPEDLTVVWTDGELDQLVEDFVAAARAAADVGFQFVDVKCCHGYLLHEFLSARCRPGRYGGDFEGRTRLLLSIISRIRQEIPSLAVAVRLSVYDSVPFECRGDIGRPADYQRLLPYRWGFGVREDDPLEVDLDEPLRLLELLRAAGVVAVNLSCGSPYYTPHMQRPALFPPSDGYPPPHDPLIEVARQIHVARQCQQHFPDWPMVGSGYSYLQEFLPLVAQAVVRAGWISAVGIGRAVLAYPELPADSLLRGQLDRKRICRTFSDCTTAPRSGLVSGCYPLDPFYKNLPEYEILSEIKLRMRRAERDT